MCGHGISGAHASHRTPPKYASVADQVNAARQAGKKVTWPPQNDVMERPKAVPRAPQPNAPTAPPNRAGPLSVAKNFMAQLVESVMNGGQKQKPSTQPTVPMVG